MLRTYSGIQATWNEKAQNEQETGYKYGVTPKQIVMNTGMDGLMNRYIVMNTGMDWLMNRYNHTPGLSTMNGCN